MKKRQKLNLLQRLLPDGLVANVRWFAERGYSGALLHEYRISGWLEQPARGVYRRPGGRLLWQNVVMSLQNLLKVPAAVGGRTALELQGYSHYLHPGDVPKVHLHTDVPLPGWVDKLGINTEFVPHNAKRLFRSQSTASFLANVDWNHERQSFVGDVSLQGGLQRMGLGLRDWPMTLSTPERAVLELLDELPHRETFHQVDKLMEGLLTLNPNRLQALLEDCGSIKVKRLFFWYSDRHDFPWRSRLKQDGIDLGSGKRLLVRGGRMDSKYRITVPEDMDGHQ